MDLIAISTRDINRMPAGASLESLVGGRGIPVDGGNLVPTGLGKPCTIKIETVYTGKYGKGLFSGFDMLLTSAMKSLGVTDAQPRSLNFLERNVGRRYLSHSPSTTQPGTQLIFYSPALTRLRGTLTIEMAFDDVNESDFSAVSKLLKDASSLSIFLPASGYLMLGSQIVNLVGRFAASLFDAKAEWQADFTLDLEPVIGDPTASGLYLGIDPDVWATLKASGHKISNGEVVDKNGQRYLGDSPYVMISVDGRPDDALKEFQSLALSAEIASRFLNATGVFTASLEAIYDALRIANDWKYRQQAVGFDSQIKQQERLVSDLTERRQRTQDPAEQAELDKQIAAANSALNNLRTRRSAAVANILNGDLTPKFG